MRNKIGIIVLILGIILISLSVYIYYDNDTQDKEKYEVSMKILNDFKVKDTSNKVNSEVSEDNIDGYNVFGIIKIDKLDLELPILDNYTKENLDISPCVYKGNVDSNLIIAAHSSKYHFGRLNRLKIGDVVHITDRDLKEYTYSLVKTEELTSTDIEKMTNTTYDLTLFTCTYSGINRYVLRFKKV